MTGFENNDAFVIDCYWYSHKKNIEFLIEEFLTKKIDATCLVDEYLNLRNKHKSSLQNILKDHDLRTKLILNAHIVAVHGFYDQVIVRFNYTLMTYASGKRFKTNELNLELSLLEIYILSKNY